MKFSVAVLIGSALLYSENYTLGPDSQPQSGVPKGVTEHELEAGKFYSGTPHTYSIYVPAQYEAARPTPLMIFLDGGAFLSDSVVRLEIRKRLQLIQ